jgi:hypothetical protein
MLKLSRPIDKTYKSSRLRTRGFSIILLFMLLSSLLIGCSRPSNEECIPDSIFGPDKEGFGYTIDNMSELRQLLGYNKTTGDIVIYQTDISSLNDLRCLTIIGGYLSVLNNKELASLDGLGNVTSVGWSVGIGLLGDIKIRNSTNSIKVGSLVRSALTGPRQH